MLTLRFSRAPKCRTLFALHCDCILPPALIRVHEAAQDVTGTSVMCTHLQTAACFPPAMAKAGPEKHDGAPRLREAALNRTPSGRKVDVSALTLLLWGLRVTSKSGSALSLSSKGTLASLSSPLDLSLFIHTVRGMNSGWYAAHCLVLGMPPLPDDTAEWSPCTLPGGLGSASERSLPPGQQSLPSDCLRPPHPHPRHHR